MIFFPLNLNQAPFITEGKEGVRRGRGGGLQAGQEEQERQGESQVRAGSLASKGQESQKGGESGGGFTLLIAAQ